MEASAKAGTVDLSLYALAQVRAEDVERSLASRCRGCSGDACGRPMRVAVAGRSEWPACPLAMIRAPSWQALVDLFLASKVAPLSGYPDNLSAWAQEGLVELHVAIKREDERQSRERSKAASAGGPAFSGRRSKHLARG